MILRLQNLYPETTLKKSPILTFPARQSQQNASGGGLAVWITADIGVGRAAQLLWLPGPCSSKTTTFLWHSCLKSRKEECGGNVPAGEVVIREQRLEIWQGVSKLLGESYFTDLTIKFHAASFAFRSMAWLQPRWRVERGKKVRDNVSRRVCSVLMVCSLWKFGKHY